VLIEYGKMLMQESRMSKAYIECYGGHLHANPWQAEERNTNKRAEVVLKYKRAEQCNLTSPSIVSGISPPNSALSFAAVARRYCAFRRQNPTL
jgi:hypothetical protein